MHNNHHNFIKPNPKFYPDVHSADIYFLKFRVKAGQQLFRESKVESTWLGNRDASWEKGFHGMVNKKKKKKKENNKKKTFFFSSINLPGRNC